MPNRLARRIGLDRNLLRRRTDRVEAWLRLALAVAAVVCGPVLVSWVGAAAYGSTLAAAERDREHLFPVDAVLMEDTVGLAYVQGEDGVWPVSVMARWTAPNGGQRTGQVITESAGAAGAVVVIWTDVRGNVVDRANSPSPSGAALGAGIVTALGIAAIHASILLVVRRSLNRRRMASWELEWAVVEPRWSSRR
jgi:hypothetical protein